MIGLLLLPGCAPGGSEAVPAPPRLVCPALVPYTPDQQAKAADELGALPADSEVGQMVQDYLTERDRIRALCGVPNGDQ